MTVPDSLQQAPENSQDQENIHSSSRNLSTPTKQPFPKVREAQRTIPRCPQEETSKRKEKVQPSPPHPKYQKHPKSPDTRQDQPANISEQPGNDLHLSTISTPSRTIPKVLRTIPQDTLINRQQRLVNSRKTPH